MSDQDAAPRGAVGDDAAMHPDGAMLPDAPGDDAAMRPNVSGHEAAIQPDALMLLARAAAERAYVPYSHFRVGAAVETDGMTFGGCNVENASYGLTVCAERVALFTAVAAGHRRISRLAVTCLDASPALGEPGRMPCGACRQVMVELMGPDGVVLVDGVRTFLVSELLPTAFTL